MSIAVSSVNSTTTAQQALAAGSTRISVTVENNDSYRCFVLLGSPAVVGTVTSTNYTFSLTDGASANITEPEVYEEVWVIWEGNGSGALQITTTTTETSVGGSDANMGDMKERIASDLERSLSDTTHVALSRTWDNEIEDAITDAVQLYRSRPFWFLQQPQSVSLTSTTTADDSYVSEYEGLIKLDSLRITINGQRYQLNHVSFDTMESFHDGNPNSGQPTSYTRHGGRVRLYPTPDAAYTLTWSGTFLETALTGDEITNGWMTHGQLLIRATARLILLRDYIKSYDDVPAAQQAVDIAEKALYREHIMRTSNNRVVKRY